MPCRIAPNADTVVQNVSKRAIAGFIFDFTSPDIANPIRAVPLQNRAPSRNLGGCAENRLAGLAILGKPASI